MPDTMVGVVMVLLTESLFAYVLYEYFKIFFERKNMKGIFLYIYFISVLVQFALRYVPDNMAYIRLITTILFLFTIQAPTCVLGSLLLFPDNNATDIK